MRLAKLEALRGFAAAYVVAHHSLPGHIDWLGVDWGYLFRFGQEAVMLFFLISGFVIHYSYQRSTDRSFKTYFLKRATRIYVPLVCVLALTYAFWSVQEGRWVDPEWGTLLGNLLMLQNWGAGAFIEPYKDNLPLWSLSFEWWFYMLYYPFASRIGDPALRTRVALAVSVGAAVGWALFPNQAIRTLMYFGLWWCGVVLADRMIRGERIDFRSIRLPLAALASVDAILALNLWWRFDELREGSLSTYPILGLRHFAFATLALVAAVVWHRLRWIGFRLLFRPFAILAPISYGMYISHFRIVRNREYLAFIGHPVVEYFVAIASMLAIATLLERVLYPPLRDWILPRLQSARPGRRDHST